MILLSLSIYGGAYPPMLLSLSIYGGAYPPMATAGLARSAGFGRFVDHKPQRSHLKGLSHSFPSMVSLDSVAPSNVDYTLTQTVVSRHWPWHM